MTILNFLLSYYFTFACDNKIDFGFILVFIIIEKYYPYLVPIFLLIQSVVLVEDKKFDLLLETVVLVETKKFDLLLEPVLLFGPGAFTFYTNNLYPFIILKLIKLMPKGLFQIQEKFEKKNSIKHQ